MFSYTEGSSDGPQNWGKLSPAYKACGQGKQQSPIDIVTKQAIPNANLDSLNRTYGAVSATLINDGHDITVCSLMDAWFGFDRWMILAGLPDS